MPPWLIPVGVLAAVSLVAMLNVFADLAAIAVGWVVIPFGIAHVRSHTRPPDAGALPEADMHYWRSKPL